MELLEIIKQKKDVDSKYKIALSSYINSIELTLADWKIKLTPKQYETGIRHLFIHNMLRNNGSDYFTWGNSKKWLNDFSFFKMHF